MTNRLAQPLGSAGAPRDVLQPALSTSILKYHTIPRARLVAHTELGLASAGVLGAALGRRDGDTINLTGCIVLAPYAREHLPSDLGLSSRRCPLRQPSTVCPPDPTVRWPRSRRA